MKTASKTPLYSLIHALYWSTHGLMFSFASAYLLNKNFSSGQIGLIMGLSYALSACLQPMIASFVRKTGVRLSACMACILALIAILSLALLVLPLNGLALAAVMVCALLLQSALQPSINSLHRGYQLQGVRVNFGFARGVGSAAFSLVTLLTGQLLSRMSPNLLPALYLTTVLMLIVCLIAYRSPSFAPQKASVKDRREPLLKRYPRFGLFLLGLILLAMAHICISNFMLQVMQSVGGGSQHMGVAISIASITELPAMILYARMAKKAGPNRILLMAGWAWAAKNFLIMIARSPEAIYAAELLQFLSYAVYVPAAVDYVAQILPEGDFLKGQALSGSAFTLGSLLAAVVGGLLIDLAGVRFTLAFMQFVTLAGAALFTIAVSPRKKSKKVPS